MRDINWAITVVGTPIIGIDHLAIELSYLLCMWCASLFDQKKDVLEMKTIYIVIIFTLLIPCVKESYYNSHTIPDIGIFWC